MAVTSSPLISCDERVAMFKSRKGEDVEVLIVQSKKTKKNGLHLYALDKNHLSERFGYLWLKVKKGFYPNETADHLEISRIDNLVKRRLAGIGRAFIEIAVEESLKLGLEGKISLMALGPSHLFYLKCGFRPMEYGYRYPDCPSVTRHLKRLGLQNRAESNTFVVMDPYYQRAQEILAKEFHICKENVDSAFIKERWFWDEKYPLKIEENCALFYEHVRAFTQLSPRETRLFIFDPLPMYLPAESLEIWKRIIATAKENRAERDQLWSQLRAPFWSE